jgi:molybdopterin/thiamine biosynthesis adenylyltransferase
VRDPGATDPYSRQRPAGYDPELLHEKRVLIAGAGSLAQPLCEALALSGLRELVIVDRDRFEPHNRAKSSHFPHSMRDADAGELPYKAEHVAGSVANCATAEGAMVRSANSWVEALGSDVFETAHIVVSAVDAIPARRYLARKAVEWNKPLVTGGFSGHRLWYEVYPAAGAASERPCWDCGRVPDGDVFSCRHYAEAAARESVIPAIQTGAMTLAGFMAEAAIMTLHGNEPIARGVSIDLRSGETLRSRLLPDPECAARHRTITIDARVDVHPSDGSARDVMSALDTDEGVVRLDAPFVHRAACRSCEQQTLVEQPLWAWIASPKCRDCGGQWPLSGMSGDRLPPVETPQDLRRTDEAWRVPLGSLGVAPGDVVQVSLPGGDLAVKLAGSSDEMLRCHVA